MTDPYYKKYLKYKNKYFELKSKSKSKMKGGVDGYGIIATILSILAMGGIGIMVGLGTWGYKIIKRIGSELTKITPSRGFIIELSDALAVLIATQIKMPVSTTHCQVGSVLRFAPHSHIGVQSS